MNLGTDGFWFDTVTDSFRYTFNDEKTWRHLALVLNENDDKVSLYLDGVLIAFKDLTAFGPVSDLDCGSTADRKMGFGHNAAPGFTYGAEVEIYDMRIYPHAAYGPLAPATIMQMAKSDEARSALSLDVYGCKGIDDAAMKDQTWADEYGHGCSWYATNMKDFPSICNYPNAAVKCPKACQSRQECWLNALPSDAYWTWDGVRRVEPGQSVSTAGGALCLASTLDEGTVKAECKKWVANKGSEEHLEKWQKAYDDSTNKRLDFMDCEAVSQAIHTPCAFNSTAVEEFTRKSLDNNGDFSVAFWIAPIGQASLQKSGQFIPHLHFMSTISPPTHHMVSFDCNLQRS